MKMTLTQALVLKMRWAEQPLLVAGQLKWVPNKKDNYVVFDDHRNAPGGFSVRVGKNAAVYYVETDVGPNKSVKVRVGLASGKKGGEEPISLDLARELARKKIIEAKELGGNPKKVAKVKRAQEWTLGAVWDEYTEHLTTRVEKPIKPNSLKALNKARSKLKGFEDRLVNELTADDVLEVFDEHAGKKGHQTAAEHMGRWANAAVNWAIEREIHTARDGEPKLKYNPFGVLKIYGRMRSTQSLETAYQVKKVRNPIRFDKVLPAFLDAAWSYRRENRLGADFLILSLLWGLRLGEACTFVWKDRVSEKEAITDRWIDLDTGTGCITNAKNGANHLFAIGPCAMRLLKIRRASVDDDEKWVFPSSSKLTVEGHYKDPTIAMRTIKKRTNEILIDRHAAEQRVDPDSGQKCPSIEVLRGHDLRRTFGAACEKLGFSDRQTQRMLGHSVTGGAAVRRYTEQEIVDMRERMTRVETLMLRDTAEMFHALSDGGELLISRKQVDG